MSKVLISFLGTGPINKGKSNREYRYANYKFDDSEELFSTSFVAKALYMHYDIDKIILVGTPKSMWENVYEEFCLLHNQPRNDDYWIRLAEYCDNANYKSPLEIPNPEMVESALGEDSHIALIHYGLNSAEIENNAAIILGLEKYLNKNDELYIDVTHSFRSLPLYLMNLLIYLQNVSTKNVKVKRISYGMLDVSGELNYTPVVDLSCVMELNSWVTGAYAFKEYGNGYQIADLMKTKGDNGKASKLMKFTDMLCLNHIAGIRHQTQELMSLKNETFGPIGDFIVPKVLDNFVKNLSNCKDSTFQLRLAQWHFEHKNYSSSFIAIVESIITYVCEETKKDWRIKDNRELAKKNVLSKKDHEEQRMVREVEQVIGVYRRVNKIRKSVAHSVELEINNKNMISCLKEALAVLREIIKG